MPRALVVLALGLVGCPAMEEPPKFRAEVVGQVEGCNVYAVTSSAATWRTGLVAVCSPFRFEGPKLRSVEVCEMAKATKMESIYLVCDKELDVLLTKQVVR